MGLTEELLRLNLDAEKRIRDELAGAVDTLIRHAEQLSEAMGALVALVEEGGDVDLAAVRTILETSYEVRIAMSAVARAARGNPDG